MKKKILFVKDNILNYKKYNIDVFSLSIWLVTSDLEKRNKLLKEISNICKEFEGEISTVTFEGSLLLQCRFNCKMAAESFRDTVKLEYEID